MLISKHQRFAALIVSIHRDQVLENCCLGLTSKGKGSDFGPILAVDAFSILIGYPALAAGVKAGEARRCRNMNA
jgi:hypothetical protein